MGRGYECYDIIGEAGRGSLLVCMLRLYCVFVERGQALWSWLDDARYFCARAGSAMLFSLLGTVLGNYGVLRT